MHLNDIIDKTLDDIEINIEVLESLSYDFETEKDVDEYSDKSLLNLCIPFIKAKIKNDIKFYEEFSEIFSRLFFIKKLNLSYTHKSIESLNFQVNRPYSLTRDHKIHIIKHKKSFMKKTRDYNDREWIIDLLLYFYYITVEEIQILRTLEIIENERLKENSKTQDNNKFKEIWALQINNKNERREILMDKNKPKMSLEEYADIIMENMKKIEKYNSQITQSELIDSEDRNIFIEKSLKELREEDEYNDLNLKGSGNTKGMG